MGSYIRVNNYCNGVCMVQATKCIIVTQYITINFLKQLSAFKFLCLLVITNNKYVNFCFSAYIGTDLFNWLVYVPERTLQVEWKRNLVAHGEAREEK